jgi:alkylated DNA repair dioxygenase AlkB
MVADSGWQPLLWPGATSDRGFAEWPMAARRSLSHGAWVDHVAGWLAQERADELFAVLHRDIRWRADRRQMFDRDLPVPRLTAWFPQCERTGVPLLEECRAELNTRSDSWNDPLVSAGLCLYRDGRDSVAWHGDRIGRGRHGDTIVAVLSLGSARQFQLRPRGGGESLRYTVGHGDLLVMGGSCQRTWDHAVPKTRQFVGARISVQFRPKGVA